MGDMKIKQIKKGILTVLLMVVFPLFQSTPLYGMGIFKCPAPLDKLFPDPILDKLAEEIPAELRNLEYGVYPDNILYDKARFNFNKRFNVFPKAIFMPRTDAEIAFVLSTLEKYGLEFSVRSGQHCYEPGSLSSNYIIDTRNFNSIIPNMQKQEVYVGAAVRLNDLINTLGEIGFAVPSVPVLQWGLPV